MSKLQILLNNLKLTKKTQECRCCFSYDLLVPITLPRFSFLCTRYLCNVHVDIYAM